MAIWAYIDGTCDEAEQQRIAGLIATDAVWQSQYQELRLLNEALNGSLEMDQPSMRFTKDVMDIVATTHIARPASTFINPLVIKGIAAFFIISIALFTGYVVLNVQWHRPSKTFLNLSDLSLDHMTRNMHLEQLLSNATINVVLGCTVVLGLVFLDSVLRKSRKAHA